MLLVLCKSYPLLALTHVALYFHFHTSSRLQPLQEERKAMEHGYDVPEGVDIRGRYDEEFAKILTKDALKFVADLQREFRNHIKYALECRREAKRRYNEGALPGFDPATRNIREQEWVCAPVPQAVADRKVEITGPVERKMIINALNSGAKVFMVSTCAQYTLHYYVVI